MIFHAEIQEGNLHFMKFVVIALRGPVPGCRPWVCRARRAQAHPAADRRCALRRFSAAGYGVVPQTYNSFLSLWLTHVHIDVQNDLTGRDRQAGNECFGALQPQLFGIKRGE